MPPKVEFPPAGQRILASPANVAATWKATATRIPAQYALGTAQHESDYTLNEVDTEESGFVSRGIFQLSDEECAKVGDDPLTLEGSCAILARISEQRLEAILKAIGLDPKTPMVRGGQIWAYVALAHNEGLHACLKTLRLHGLSWDSYKARNPESRICAYGDDCISGGAMWKPAFSL